MELIEVVARTADIAADGLTGGGNKKTGKAFYMIATILVIAIFVFTLIMSK